ncbi:MAG TPA: PorP/SprF family type IX secretion system membrane protein [Sphingobacteriaceae bacterium]
MNKNYIVLIGLVFTGLFSNAQQRTQIANFSQFQQYYNPALTGNEGSMVKSFYRDHFDGSDEAPKTLFVAGELNLADIGGKAGTEGALTHALGLSLLNDNYGSLKNSRIALSYNSGFKLTKTLRLHAGAAVTYDVNKFDNEGLVFDGPDDQSALNESINKLGVNAGVAVRAADYYIGYALTDLIEENLSDNTIFQDLYAMQHVVQAGYRRALTQSFGVIVNGIYRYDERQKSIAEAQVKGVYNNMLWIGAGYRNDLAYTVNAGIRFSQFKIGYSREVNSSSINGAFNSANEFTLSYNINSLVSGKKLSIW